MCIITVGAASACFVMYRPLDSARYNHLDRHYISLMKYTLNEHITRLDIDTVSSLHTVKYGTDCNNCRPIAIATITSKLLESIILLKCEEYFFTSDNRFGFKAGHSTEFCIYSLLEFIDFYKKRNTTVFVTFLDASKAFSRVN